MGRGGPVILNAGGSAGEVPPGELAALLKWTMGLLRVECFDPAAGRVRIRFKPYDCRLNHA